MGHEGERKVDPGEVAPAVAGGAITGGGGDGPPEPVTYHGSGGGSPAELTSAVGHWSDADALALQKRMTNARRAISGRARGNVDAARASGVEVGAELFDASVVPGLGDAGGARAARAITAGEERAREQYALGEVLAVQSEGETLAAAANQAGVAEQISDPQTRARALALLESIDRNRRNARTESAALRLDELTADNRAAVLDRVSENEPLERTSEGMDGLIHGAPAAYAASVLDRLGTDDFLHLAGGVPGRDREALAPIAESIDDPLRAATLRSMSVPNGPAETNAEAWARLKLTGAGLVSGAERLWDVDLGGREKTSSAITGLLQEEVSRRTGVRIDNEPETPSSSLVADPSRRWTPADLRTVEETLQRLPAAHRAAAVDVNRSQNQDLNGNAGYAARGRGIMLMEPAFDGSPGRRMSLPDPLAARGGQANWLEEVVTHEVGHQVSFANGDAPLRRLSSLAGWAGETLPPGHLPDGHHWHIARENPHQNFAELYASAVNSPTRLYEEFRAAPTQEVRASRRELRRLERAGSEEDAIQAARGRATRAREIAASREAQWRFMREEVFGVNDAIVAQRAAALLTQSSGNEASARAFTHEARKVMTPHQLDALFRRYQRASGREP